MNHDQVTELLRDYRSYKYAVKNCGPVEGYLPRIYSERRRMHPNAWDAARYNRIVNMIEGAVDDVLSDDERMVISRKYLERNKMSLKQIAGMLNVDPSTVSRWHTEALRQLSKALAPLTEDEREITNFDHMWTA